MRVVHKVPQRGRGGTDTEAEGRFGTLYRENLSDITAYAVRRSSSAEDAADVVADVFLVAWRRFGEIPEGNAAKLWLYGVARRVLSNKRRAQGRRSQLSVRLAEELQVYEPALFSASSDLPAGFGEAFARLSERYREVLGLSVWEELDTVSIAKVLSCSPNAARILVHRARRQLRTELTRLGIVKDPDKSGHEPDVRIIQTKEGR